MEFEAFGGAPEPGLPDNVARAALEDQDEGEDDVEDGVEPDQGVGGPEHETSLTLGDEETEELCKDPEFDKEDVDGIYDASCMVKLERFS